MIHVLSAIALTVLIGASLWGIFSRGFRENWLQFAGLCGMLLWLVPRLVEVIEEGPVTPLQLLAHWSIACFTVGTVWRFRNGRCDDSTWGEEEE